MRAATATLLHKHLVENFSLSELQTLCLYLGVKYDSLGGDNLDAKARELILYLERHGRLPELEAQIAQMRPEIRESDMQAPLLQITVKKVSITLAVTLSLAFAIWWGITARNAPSGDFEFQAVVQDATGSPITRAEAVLLIGGNTAPLVVYTDKNGIALFQLKPELAGKSAVLRISHPDYVPTEQHIDLHRDMLPLTVVLTSP